jgi:hypothetical protein
MIGGPTKRPNPQGGVHVPFRGQAPAAGRASASRGPLARPPKHPCPRRPRRIAQRTSQRRAAVGAAPGGSPRTQSAHPDTRGVLRLLEPSMS